MDTIQTHVFTGGQWTTNTIPRSEYIARMNKDAAAKTTSGDLPTPKYGLLTRTLVPSPVIKKALPVKCRVGGVGDVAFIGESYIELASTEEDGKMQRNIARHKFEAVILDAIAFRHRPRPTRNIRSGSQGLTASTAPAGLVDDLFGEVVALKQEPGSSQQQSKRPKAGSSLPPELLVLSLDTGDLVFCYVNEGPKGYEWVVSPKKVGAAGVRDAEDKPGKSLAVDPRSRYIHVCTFGSRWYLLRMASTEELEAQLLRDDGPAKLDPVLEIRVDRHGLVVLHACFLYPKSDELDHTLLLLTVIDAQKNYRVILHEWNNITKQSLKDIDLRKEGIRLFDNVTMPLYVVPLSTNSTFLMVTEYEILFGSAAEIHSGNSNFIPLQYNSSRILLSPSNLVSSIATISKAKSFKSRIDYVYYTLSSGSVHLLELEVKDLKTPEVLAHCLVSHPSSLLPSPSIAVFSDLLTANDTLIIPGECSSGGILILHPSASKATFTPEFHPVLSNYAPIFDTALVPPPTSPTSDGPGSIFERDRLFVTAGVGPGGAVAELRTGYQAQVQTSADYVPLIRDIWALPDANGTGFYLLSSTNDASNMVYLDRDGGMEMVDEGIAHALNLDAATVAAGRSGDVSVQVTKSSVRLVRLGSVKEEGGVVVKTEPFVRDCGAGETIVRADVKCGYIAVVMSVGNEVRLVIAEAPSDGRIGEGALNPIGEHVLLSDESSTVGIVEIGGAIHVMVGTWGSSVQVYRLEEGFGLMPVTEVALEEAKDGDISMEPGAYICEDVQVLEHEGHTRLFCGLRGGSLVSFNVDNEDDMLSLNARQEARIASVPVMFMKGTSKSSMCSVVAGPDIYQLALNGSTFSISPVIFEGSQQPQINAATRLSIPDSAHNIIVCVTEEELFYANISSSLQTCVRPIPLHATPRRLLYYSTLEILIVACLPQTQPKPSPTTLKFLNPTTGEFLHTGELLDSESKKPIFDRPNEQINALTEWKVRAPNNLEWRYIVAGTQFTSDQTKKGRMVFLSVQKSDKGSVTIRKRYTWRLEAPVYAISPAGNKLVYSSGKSVFIGDLDVETKRFRQIDEYNKLRSPAIFITTSCSSDRVPPTGHLTSRTASASESPKETTTITISTAADSLHILHFSSSKLVSQHNDDRARNGFSHLSFTDDPNFWLLTDKNYGLSGVWAPSKPDMLPATARLASQSLRTVFEAALPVSISRIQSGRSRAAWSSRPSDYLVEGVKATIHEGRELIATGVDGTVLSLSVLTKEVFELLKRLSVEIVGSEARRGKHHHEHHKDKAIERRVLKGDGLAELGRETFMRAVEAVKREKEGRAVLQACFGDNEGKWNEAAWGVVESLLGGVVL
ncbi:hypothetical protein BJ508DRAFT_411612 [Ascobolus immersus RN42]|uniref:RSE1/DDB1/CPSF1 first beta-propeller domain-containing protein n=1 Tax=Ascobolus immersus RN42 TaxID=1160509 RepID=A0A3N4IK29_ASCIM|nr:hypothetical protein BJ508DRAFT_411612 [Ascobolus immersus RN42]